MSGASTVRPGGAALAACLAGLLGFVPGCGSRPRRAGDDRARGVSPDLESFLRGYFESWSAGDMGRYASHFHEDAFIVLIEDGEVREAAGRDRFVRQQERIRASSPGRPVERMTSFVAHEDATAASVTARWELDRGAEKATGVDRFVLMRDAAGEWKIVLLLFYSDA